MSEKWWNENYIDRRKWIMENLEKINVSPAEALIVLLIDYLNETGSDFTLNSLSEKLHLSEKETDALISSLVSKGYLKITSENGRVRFLIDGVFSEKTEKRDLSSVFDLFEEEFGRVLSQSELQEINDWLSVYKQDDIIYALRQASIYNKKSFPYIRSILKNFSRGQNEN